MYDAIVVGARCAGSPTAMLLARAGHRVLLVDKASFPSDRMSSHMIFPPGLLPLKRWGLLDRLAATNCPPVRKVTVDYGDFALTGNPPQIEGIPGAFAARRKVLDKLLVDAAVESGVELREEFTVLEILMDGDRVTGIKGRTKDGQVCTEQAKIVVGADGMHSLVAKTVGTEEYRGQPSLACYYYSYWSGVDVEGFELYRRGRRALFAFPTNDNLVCITIGWPRAEFHDFRSDIEGNYLKTIDLVPSLSARVGVGHRAERFVGTGDVPNYFRKPYGQGWALVGDAGYHKDPYTAQGITDAFHSAEYLSEAIDAGLTGREPMEQALAQYEKKRNDGVQMIYDATCQLAALEPFNDYELMLRGALRGNQEEIDRYCGTVIGTVSVTEFFAPRNIRRIMAAARPATVAV